MNDNRIEEMARAIYAGNPMIAFWDRPGGPPGNGHVPWERLEETYRERARKQAAAALDASGLIAENELYRAALEAARDILCGKGALGDDEAVMAAYDAIYPALQPSDTGATE